MATGRDSIRVFVSYGRRDASAFVDKLCQDLKQAGYDVWRDTAELNAARPWDDQLQTALKRSDVVIAVLTPHAVRTEAGPDTDSDASVCLDELAFARFSLPPTPIVPLLLMQCEPPFVIYRLQYLDFLGAPNDETAYREAFAKLVEAIESAGTGAPVAYRATEFEPLDFDLYLKVKTRDFVGREWLLSKLLEDLQQPDSPSAHILVGDPGWGKTAFAGYLFGANPAGQLLAAHFCRVGRTDSIDPRRLIESLVAMTAARLPAIAPLLGDLAQRHKKLLAESKFHDAMERLFIEPIATLDPTTLGALPRYILVDGLDEAAAAPMRPTVDRLLAETIHLFPDWLKLVATSRVRSTVLDGFGSAEITRLDHNDVRNRDDVRSIVAHLLAVGEVAASTDDGGLLEIIDDKAEGNALCAVQLAQAARRSGMDRQAIAELPRGLAALYRTILLRRFEPGSDDWKAVREVLEMVVAAGAPLPIKFAAIACGDTSEYLTRGAVESTADLLVIDNDRVRLFHQTFAEFLTDPASTFFVNPVQGALRLLDVVTEDDLFGSLPEPLRAFARDNFMTWIGQCDPRETRAGSLPAIIDRLVFNRTVDAVSRIVDSVRLDEADDRMIRRFVGAGLSAPLVETIKLAFARADDHLRASRYSPMGPERLAAASGRHPETLHGERNRDELQPCQHGACLDEGPRRIAARPSVTASRSDVRRGRAPLGDRLAGYRVRMLYPRNIPLFRRPSICPPQRLERNRERARVTRAKSPTRIPDAVQAARRRSEQTDFLQLRLDDLAIERLEDVVVGAGPHRPGDMADVVLAGAKDDGRPVAARHGAERGEELHPVHHRHMPVDQNHVRHRAAADGQRFAAVLRLADGEVEILEDAARHLADDAGVIDDEAMLHPALPGPAEPALALRPNTWTAGNAHPVRLFREG